MPSVSASIEITNADDMRVMPRQGGGFHLLIGPLGGDRLILSFPDVTTAEALAVVLCTSTVTHGRLGAAVAATAPDASNVVPLTRPTPRPDFTPPSAA
ncbi:hypothetical protein [Caulobacter segnis]|uniref:Uncharacterized protein n=1 Tax=Caulobacter segnis TaxID=88688 RepID=A0A2W5V9H1_9CAUL|nr:hypothetical protein [Caulobacter segnis]PZR36460.1 MAG: hypothetical protein DI526_03210 [Caulobacter segnis]